MPRAMDSSISPLDVSSDMAVVKTLVNPLILPPTIRANPTSEIARPKASKIAAITANLASLRTTTTVWKLTGAEGTRGVGYCLIHPAESRNGQAQQ